MNKKNKYSKTISNGKSSVKYIQECHCEEHQRRSNLVPISTGLLRFVRNDGVYRIYTSNGVKLVVEGGATKTIGVFNNKRYTVGPTNLHVVGVSGVYKNLRKLINHFKKKPKEYHFYLSGLKSKKDKTIMKSICKKLRLKGKIILSHDLLGGLLRESKDGTGIIVVSGTGSAVYGRNAKGQEAQVGGMGEKIGDEAGAYSIAIAGMRAAVRSYDGRGPITILEKKFGRIEELTDWLEGKSKPQIAKLAPIVFKAAGEKDKVAEEIIDNAVNNLIGAVKVVEKKIGPQKIFLSGGNFEHQPMFRQKFVQKLDMYEVAPRTPSVRGATSHMIGKMIEGDRDVVCAVEKEKDNIVKAIKKVVSAFRNGGRLFYVGAGTSGRIAMMDADECPPTFNVPRKMVQAITTGDSEDRYCELKNITDRDVVIGISASGTTPFVVSALRKAEKKGAYTILVTSSKKGRAKLAIRLNTGPEIIEGSTRLKAGTAAKMVLNIISTISMIKLGRTFGNLMIDVKPKNKKLVNRAVGIISDICGVREKRALEFLRDANYNTRKGIRIGLGEKIKPMLMFGFTKDKVPEDTGSAIIFDRNVKYLNRIKKFMSIDQEGGRVNRIWKGVTVLPAQRDVKSEKEAYENGKVLARELLSLGIQLDLTPVVDVNTEPTNPIIGDRSFGDDTKRVSRLGCAMIRGMQNNGLIACAKHFPGHGPTKKDSHKCLPRVDISYKEWKKVHLPPFINAIKAGVASIMPGHILYSCLDNKLPSSLSYKIVTEILREKLGFKGVIITDDLRMSGITNYFPPEEAAVLSIIAGNDIVLVCKGRAVQKRVINAIIDAILDGRISLSRINESLERIKKLIK